MGGATIGGQVELSVICIAKKVDVRLMENQVKGKRADDEKRGDLLLYI